MLSPGAHRAARHPRMRATGTHAALLARDGPYARMWRRQSGGFITDPAVGALDTAAE